jgi:hypothetical protein
MTTLTVSSKYQIVIPARMRESPGIRPGARIPQGHRHRCAEGTGPRGGLRLQGAAKPLLRVRRFRSLISA